MKVLYRFKLDTETGEITTIKINNYEDHTSGKSPYYRYRGSNQYNYVKVSNLDRLFCNSVYTFCSNPKHAKSIIRKALQEKADKLKSQYDAVCETISKMEV